MLVGSVTWGLGTSTSSSWELTDFSPTCTEFESELPLALHCLQGIGKSAFGVEFAHFATAPGRPFSQPWLQTKQLQTVLDQCLVETALFVRIPGALRRF